MRWSELRDDLILSEPQYSTEERPHTTAIWTLGFEGPRGLSKVLSSCLLLSLIIMAIDSYGYYAFLPSLSLPASTPIQSSPRFLAYLSNPKPPPIYPKASCCLFLVESYFHPSAILPSPFLYRGCMVRNLASVYSIYTVEYPNTLIIQHGII